MKQKRKGPLASDPKKLDVRVTLTCRPVASSRLWILPTWLPGPEFHPVFTALRRRGPAQMEVRLQ
jgi:hypothetical protein